MRFHVINETQDFSLRTPSLPLPLFLSVSAASVRDKIDFIAVVSVLANISDAIMQRHRARSSASLVLAGCCQDELASQSNRGKLQHMMVNARLGA